MTDPYDDDLDFLDEDDVVDLDGMGAETVAALGSNLTRHRPHSRGGTGGVGLNFVGLRTRAIIPASSGSSKPRWQTNRP